MHKLDRNFYNRKDVVKIARELLGKILVTNWQGTITSGRIVETEAYNGIVDKASHAYGGRRTQRTEIMFGEAGTAYVYLCYGIHHMFNVVTGGRDVPHAILIRAIEPIEGIETMLDRTNKKRNDYTLGSGPGNVCKALGIFTNQTGTSLQSDDLFIADDGVRFKTSMIKITPRIGVDYAGDDALLDYRFSVKDNPHVSAKSKFK